MSPYEILIVASLVQRESKPQDFSKVARVIFNRLAENRKLEFDSTVNYSLDRSLFGDLVDAPRFRSAFLEARASLVDVGALATVAAFQSGAA